MSSNSSSSILAKLAATTPIDTSGARSANRFQFQLAWALCRLLELHSLGEGYAIILDYHEDVVELDDETNPTAIDFHQVKTASKNWTLRSLTKRENGKEGLKPSILGKLAAHRGTFSETRKTNFVSNWPTNFELKDGKKTAEVETYCLDDVKSSIRDGIVQKIKEERGEQLDAQSITQTVFTRTELTPADFENQCIGRVAKFLEKEVDDRSPTNAIYKTLKSELERRNNEERLSIGAGDLSSKKVFGRSHMNQLLSLATPIQSVREITQRIEANLASEQVPFGRRQAMLARIEDVFAARLDPTNTLVIKTAAKLKSVYAEWLTTDNSNTLVDALADARLRVASGLPDSYEEIYSHDHFDALFLLIAHDSNQISPATPEPTEEKA